MRKPTRTLRGSWGSASLAEAGLVPITACASHRVRSVTRPLGPRSLQFPPRYTHTHTQGGQERPWRSPGVVGGAAAERPRARPPHGKETPFASPATRAVPKPGRVGGRGRRVRNSRSRPHGAGLTPVSRSPSRRPRLPQARGGRSPQKKGGMPGPQAFPTRLPSLGVFPRQPAPIGPAVIAAPPSRCFSYRPGCQAECVRTSRVSATSDPGKGKGRAKRREWLKDHRTGRAAAADGQTAKALSLPPERLRASEKKKQDGG